MAEDPDDQWLYGEVLDAPKDDENTETSLSQEKKDTEDQSLAPPGDKETELQEEAETPTEAETKDEEEDSDDDDDDIEVTIGEYKTGPEALSYDLGSVPLKRISYQVPKTDKPQHSVVGGGLSMLDIENYSTINGEAAHEFNLDALEDKPWRKPGADITDYFNYGFNEDTWRGYCEKQMKMRAEAGAPPILANRKVINDNSKYSGLGGLKKAGPPPDRRLTGSIDVIGGSISSRRTADLSSPSEIQVMTANKRDYSRKQALPDLSLPPPAMAVPPPAFDVPPPLVSTPQSFNGISQYTPTDGFFPPQTDQYFHSYEPTQDSQWNSAQNWGSGQAPPSFITPVATTDTEDSNKSLRSRDSEAKSRDSDSKRDDKHRSRRHRSSSRSPDRHRDRHKSRDRNPSRSRSPRHHRSHKRSKREKED